MCTPGRTWASDAIRPIAHEECDIFDVIVMIVGKDIRECTANLLLDLVHWQRKLLDRFDRLFIRISPHSSFEESGGANGPLFRTSYMVAKITYAIR